MRVRTVVLAAALALLPFGARAADLVVWWEESFLPEEDQVVRELVAAFERRTGQRVDLVFHSQEEMPAETLAVVEAGHPPGFLWGTFVGASYGQWAYEGRLVDLADALGPFVAQFDRDALERGSMLDASTGKRGLYALPVGRVSKPRPRLEEPAGAGRIHPRRHPEGVGAVLVLLVRQGPAGRTQGDGA